MKRLIASVCLGAVLAACSDDGPGGNPVDLVTKVERGFHAPVGVLVAADNVAYWVQNALDGWVEPTAADRPGSIKYLKPISGCSFSKPSTDELVAKVIIDSPVAKTPIFAASLSNIKDGAKQYIEDIKKGGTGAPVPDNSAADQLGLVDVVVTETTKPVYLVLVHTNGAIFNIHTLDGVKISRIALLGYGPDGVVNAGVTPVESLNGNQLADCKIVPAVHPANYWQLVKDSTDNQDLQQKVAGIKNQADQFAGWFKKSFGVDSEAGMFGLSETSHVLVGPVPIDTSLRAKYNPFAGSTVYMTARDVLFMGSPDGYAENKKSLIVKEATTAAGGDLSKLAQQQ